MPKTLDQHPSLDIVRALVLGESGTGKTGALASLVIAGYKLYLLDFDNGIDIIISALKDHYKSDPAGLTAALRRVEYETLKDPVAFSTGTPRVLKAQAWKMAGECMKEWTARGLGPADIIVADTLSSMSDAALTYALSMNGRLNQRPHDTDYGWIADSVLLFIDALTADSPYNVIVNTHIRYLAGEDEVKENARGQDVAAGAIKGVPSARGQQIPRNVAKYFNTMVQTRTVGIGPAAKRFIETQPTGSVEVKTSNPFTVKRQYNVTDGMAALFHDLLGHGPTVQGTPSDKPTETT